MKKITLLILFGLLSSIVHSQNINFPDADFKTKLLNHGGTITGTGISTIDTNSDGEISVAEAQAYTGTIDVSGYYLSNGNIRDLSGIEHFVNITELNYSYNQITSLDVSVNTALTTLDCAENQLTSLALNTNTALTALGTYLILNPKKAQANSPGGGGPGGSGWN